MTRTRLALSGFLAFRALLGPTAIGHEWKAGPAAPPGLGPRMTRIAYDGARRTMVLFGGNDGTLMNDTWEYDGVAWTPGPAAPPALTPRTAPALGYDGVRRRVILFGGQDGVTRDDTWLYDGSAWTQGPAAPAAMSPRTESEMAFDLRRGRMVLFGGNESSTGASFLNDTWEWDGTGWSAGPAAPPALTPRTAHGMAYDGAHENVVLFGGFDGVVRDDTWLYDGAWSAGPAAPPGLTARSTQMLAYSSSSRRVLMFAGFDGAYYLNESWEFDGTTWRPGAAAPAGLEKRCLHGLAFDDLRGVAVTFGGFDPPDVYFDDTWEYGAPSHYLVGAGLGAPNPNRVRCFESDGTPAPTDFSAYGAGSWGVNVAGASVDPGTEDEILTGPGPGPPHGPQVRAFRGDGTGVAKVNFYAYGTLRFGVNVAGQDVDGDLSSELVSGAGPGDVFGPHVRAFEYDGGVLQPLGKVSFFAYGTLRYGANVHGGELDDDGYDEILTGAGPGPTFAPTVRGFDYDATVVSAIPSVTFNAFATLERGVNVAGGFLDVDSYAEIACAPGPGPSLPARFVGFDHDGAGITVAPGLDVTPFATAHGGRVGVGGVASTVRQDLIVAPGPDPAAPASVESYVYSGTALTRYGAFDAFPTYALGANASGMLACE